MADRNVEGPDEQCSLSPLGGGQLEAGGDPARLVGGDCEDKTPPSWYGLDQKTPLDVTE